MSNTKLTTPSVAKRLAAVIMAGSMAVSVGSAPTAFAAQSGSGATDMILRLQTVENNDTSGVLRDANGDVIISAPDESPVKTVRDNGDGTGSVLSDGTDTGVDVFVDDDGVPYTDPDGKIWPKDSVVTDYTGNPVLDQDGHITVKTEQTGESNGEATGEIDNEGYPIISGEGATPVKTVRPDDGSTPPTGTVYEDGVKSDPEVKVFVDSEGNPLTDANGKVYPTDQVETNEDGTPKLDENGHLIPKSEPVGDEVGENTETTVIDKDPETGKETTVVDNGDGTGSVYEDGVDTGKDVFVGEDGKPLTDDEGNIYETDDVVTDGNGNPVVDENGHITPKDGVTPDDAIGNTGTTEGGGASDNISFSVPSVINFTANSRGELTGPSAEKTYLENDSSFPIHVSSMQFIPDTGWNTVADAKGSTADNAVDFQIGPSDLASENWLDASAYLAKKAVTNQNKWSMTAKQAASVDDRVELDTKGDVNNLTSSVTDGTKIGVIQWYVTPGDVS